MDFFVVPDQRITANFEPCLTILNRLGHSVGCSTCEEIETKLTYTAFGSNSLIPYGLETDKNLSTHLAFDNYDRFVDTLNGKDTLHDTVGIIYQFLPNNYVQSNASESKSEANDSITSKTLMISFPEENISDNLGTRKRHISEVTSGERFLNDKISDSSDILQPTTSKKRRRRAFEEVIHNSISPMPKPIMYLTLPLLENIMNIINECQKSK